MNNYRICKTCQHKKTDFASNTYCGFNIDPTSEDFCTAYSKDEIEKIHIELEKAKSNITASGGLRFANYLIDFFGYIALSFLVGIFIAILSVLTGIDISFLDNMGKLTEYFLGFFLMSSYYLFFEGIFGQTPGKMITGTKVVTEDGEKAPFEKIMTRTLCRFIPFEAFSFLGTNSVGWHDSISKTSVVIK